MNAATMRAHRRNTGHLVRAGQNLVETASRTGDMAVASARTIGYRTARIVQALGDPVSLVDPEFARMGHEKVEAAMKSGQAMADGVHALGAVWQQWVFGQLEDGTRCLGELSAARNPLELVCIWQRLAMTTLLNATTAAAHLAEASSRLSGAGLDPVLTVAAANAERLALEIEKEKRR
jgi:hypothetical protein